MFNPMEALGIIPPGEQEEEDFERVLELWAPEQQGVRAAG
jgi:hypothetical protein